MSSASVALIRASVTGTANDEPTTEAADAGRTGEGWTIGSARVSRVDPSTVDIVGATGDTSDDVAELEVRSPTLLVAVCAFVLREGLRAAGGLSVCANDFVSIKDRTGASDKA